MATTTPTPHVAPVVHQLLDGLRQRIRMYVTVEGVFLIAVFLGLAFWTTFLFDRWQEPGVPWRAGILVAVGCALALLAYRWIISRLLVPLSDRSMANLVERRFGGFQDSLLTAVELEKRPNASAYDQRMLTETYQLAATQARQTPLSEIFNAAPLFTAVVLTFVVTTSIVLFTLIAPRDMNIWAQRWVYLKDLPWPRRVQLEVVEPSQLKAVGGIVKVARGEEPKLVVRAKLNTAEFPGVAYPQFLTVAYQTRDHHQRTMDRLGEATAGYQDYQFQFPPLLETLEFDVRGSDGLLSKLQIVVVDSPKVIELVPYVEYPAYTGLGPRELTLAAARLLPLGTKVTLRAKTNKPLVGVEVSYALDDGKLLPGSAELNSDKQGFTVKFPIDGNRRVLLSLKDVDGISSREPEPLAITARPDEPPQLAVRLKGVSNAVTPMARAPVVGKLSDDFGLKRAWYEYSIGDAAPQEKPLTTNVADRSELELQQEGFEIRDLNLQPGQKLLLQIKARDGYEVPDAAKPIGPNTAGSEKFPLEIVTPDQLRSLLEMRELNLRQRFEAIIGEVRETREQVGAAAIGRRAAPTGASDAAPDTTPATNFQPTPEPQPEPAADAPEEDLAADSPAARLIQAERAGQQSQKNANETLGVSSAFEEIVEELVNNRINNEELQSRLQEQIAVPLKNIGEKMFPELDKRIVALQSQLKNPTVKEDVLAASFQRVIQQEDAILVAMEAILEKMKELEDFNEALALLREIIERHEQVLEATKTERRDQLKRALE